MSRWKLYFRLKRWLSKYLKAYCHVVRERESLVLWCWLAWRGDIGELNVPMLVCYAAMKQWAYNSISRLTSDVSNSLLLHARKWFLAFFLTAFNKKKLWRAVLRASAERCVHMWELLRLKFHANRRACAALACLFLYVNFDYAWWRTRKCAGISLNPFLILFSTQ